MLTRQNYHSFLRSAAVVSCCARSLYIISLGIKLGLILGIVDGVIISAILIASTNKAKSEEDK
jgi:hypothetical protein